MGFEHSTAHHSTSQHTTAQHNIQHSTVYYSTTQHNTAPTAAQESLPPSLPPSLPSLPPSHPVISLLVWLRLGRVCLFFFFRFINLATFIAVAALRIWWVLQSPEANFRIPYEGGYPGAMEQILYSFSLQGYLNALNTVITFIKCLKFVRLNDNLNLLTKTLEICQQNIIGVLILFF